MPITRSGSESAPIMRKSVRKPGKGATSSYARHCGEALAGNALLTQPFLIGHLQPDFPPLCYTSLAGGLKVWVKPA